MNKKEKNLNNEFVTTNNLRSVKLINYRGCYLFKATALGTFKLSDGEELEVIHDKNYKQYLINHKTVMRFKREQPV